MDVNDIIDKYLDMQKRETEQREEISYRSAEGFNIGSPPTRRTTRMTCWSSTEPERTRLYAGADAVTRFTATKCSDSSASTAVSKFTVATVRNAKEMRSRFPYRIVKARWAGKSQGKQYPITLRIIGHDDIGIVTNITSIINKENNILLRSISIDSHDGLFSGMLTVTVDDNAKLESLIKKIKTVKGVNQVNR